ncbi:metalloregulator ArsR/SmtB family transcription factor [Fimbriimonas ginsengisoli]|uniref:Cobalamin B12-binding domain protein n=1 Tax=Fimbriimonas ginsengisoli Gsoil 348 TaxID=661478 RepID=A0A068NWR4_FIMGI|nr:metalloregulator ArsR/SmtB family transcription factor [Fimbriimonas ginsengisoli]AIE87886.1 cobalamin B12-binding domain protein [Fimbriimonas ginsengisoli Gsoil 348]
MSNVYHELGETSRRLILAELRSGPKNVTDLVTSTGLKQPNVSNHLARMRQRQIVRAEKVGREVFYALASPEIEAIVHSACCQGKAAVCSEALEELTRAYAAAAIEGDEQACSEVMDVAFRARMALVDIYQEVLTPAMAIVGERYKSGEINAAQEHLASNVTERMMFRTMQLIGPTRRHDKTVILGCAPNGWHVIGLRMIADYLRFCGWKTLYLGANVPVACFVSAVHQYRPEMVLLSCSCSDAIGETLHLIAALDALRTDGLSFVIGAGGRCLESHRERFQDSPLDFTASSLREFATCHLPRIEQLTPATPVASAPSR